MKKVEWYLKNHAYYRRCDGLADENRRLLEGEIFATLVNRSQSDWRIPLPAGLGLGVKFGLSSQDARCRTLSVRSIYEYGAVIVRRSLPPRRARAGDDSRSRKPRASRVSCATTAA
jgi:hypothetical protein